ncbi:hypothetical protein MT325_m214L [Paramecium bursaria chlorella virus MT325]|uniref:Uncharacterized protein m214L n=1 Tax=Paramecium bursaria Chlorella virus MT325 TaxID=346932 RepID=A7ITU4_PBCVM|nr:hypothetical protein MT325_m214L [Paramecium bursaria chlorella virus MT325]
MLRKSQTLMQRNSVTRLRKSCENWISISPRKGFRKSFMNFRTEKTSQTFCCHTAYSTQKNGYACVNPHHLL